MAEESRSTPSRRQVLRDFARSAAVLGVGAASLRAAPFLADPFTVQEAREDPEPAKPEPFRLRYLLASSMYGTLKLEEILPEVSRIGTEGLDVWPRVHGDQREQIEAMGHDRFRELLAKHDVRLRMITQYPLGPFGLKDEIAFAKAFGAKLIVTGAKGPKGLEGDALAKACVEFAKELRPHAELAARHDVTIGIENHGGSLIASPDSIRWFADALNDLDIASVGVAFAPYHLPQEPALLARLLRELGPRLAHFYAWQHGKGCTRKLPKEEELLQMPGRGSLDFAPLVDALREIRFAGHTEVFMHPVPRGIPILPTARETTEEIVRARRHLDALVAKANER